MKHLATELTAQRLAREEASRMQAKRFLASTQAKMPWWEYPSSVLTGAGLFGTLHYVAPDTASLGVAIAAGAGVFLAQSAFSAARHAQQRLAALEALLTAREEIEQAKHEIQGDLAVASTLKA